MARRTTVHRIPTAHPGDTAGLAALLDAPGGPPAGAILAILGKTEGNGCVNDFTRAWAAEALAGLLARRTGATPEEVAARTALVMSGGTEGGISPHLLVIAVTEGDHPPAPAPRLAVGTAFTPAFAPEQIGRMPMVRAVAAATRDAMAQADIAATADVHYVQVKCPLLTSARIAAAEARGATVATRDTYASMGLSRGASALGVALALGEVAEAALSDAAIGQDFSLFSARASCSAGVELERCEVVVLGNAPGWAGDLVVAHDVMADGIDLPAVQRALLGAGLASAARGQLAPEEAAARLVALLCKAEPSHGGAIRGARHIMWDDSDIPATRHARAMVGGVVAAATGQTMHFVSGGAEHQGPDGGGPVAVIARAPA
jgi:cyanuric acid amidohydrolase